MFLRVLNKVFDDKRIMVGVIWAWLIIVIAVFSEMGKFHFQIPFDLNQVNYCKSEAVTICDGYI